MDWEAPVDAWYVYLGVSVVSVAVAGVALGLPTGPPPDANRAANTLDRVAGSGTDASATWAYDAETVVIDGPTIELANEHGTSHASLEYGVVVPVRDSDRLRNVAHGAAFEDEYATELRDGDTHAVETFLSEVETEYEATSGRTLTASDELVVRRIGVDGGGDELETLSESATLEVTETSRYDNVREVTLSYDGIPGRRIALALEGVYTTETPLYYHRSKTFSSGTGEIVISDISSPTVGNAGKPPLEYEIDYEDGLLDGAGLDVGESITWENEIDRSVTLSDDAPFVEYDADTGRYHVTLVTV